MRAARARNIREGEMAIAYEGKVKVVSTAGHKTGANRRDR
jgi:hypothetical protein